jgi:predicted nucleic acid-binding protein
MLEAHQSGLLAKGLPAKPIVIRVYDLIKKHGLRLGISREVLQEYKDKINAEGIGGAYITLIVQRLSELRTLGQLVRCNERIVNPDDIDIAPKDKHIVVCAKGTRASVIVSKDRHHLINPEKAQYLLNIHGIEVLSPYDFEKKYSQSQNS